MVIMMVMMTMMMVMVMVMMILVVIMNDRLKGSTLRGPRTSDFCQRHSVDFKWRSLKSDDDDNPMALLFTSS